MDRQANQQMDGLKERGEEGWKGNGWTSLATGSDRSGRHGRDIKGGKEARMEGCSGN